MIGATVLLPVFDESGSDVAADLKISPTTHLRNGHRCFMTEDPRPSEGLHRRTPVSPPQHHHNAAFADADMIAINKIVRIVISNSLPINF